MSFAFQGFGLGEFFKAQQRLTDILHLYFWGTFDAPSAFLSLGHTLGDLFEEIEHLFDENSNPNSAILRSDNRLNVQQMLRVASHGLLDVVQGLELLLQITGVSRDRDKSWCEEFFVALHSSRLEQKVVLLDEKFAFQRWKLKLFFRVLRKNTIRQCLSILRPAQETLTCILEVHSRSRIFGSCPFDIIQKFKDSCAPKRSNFFWGLKSESTLLLILHWLYVTKLGLNDPRNAKQLNVKTYVNLIKTAWLLKVSYSSLEIDGLSEEARSLIAIMSGEVIAMFQKLREQGVDYTDPVALASEGDYEIFVEDELRNAYNRSVTESLDPHSNVEKAFLGSRTSANHQNSVQEGPDSTINKESQIWRSREAETLWSMKLKSPQSQNSSTSPSNTELQPENIIFSAISGPVSPSTSVFDTSDTSSSLRSDIEGKNIACSQSSLKVGLASGSSLVYQPDLCCPKQPEIHESLSSHKRQVMIDVPQVSPIRFDEMGINPISPKLYSWNQRVNKQELGIRPGEMEILPRELPSINLLVSYTGDRYGRWDNCNIRLFKDIASSNFRILAFKDGLEDIFDEQIVQAQDHELVPEYAYHDHEPVIYIRKNNGLNKGNHIFYKFQNASDMFNLQLAFLNELVEADFHTVRSLRIKRSSVENYWKAGVQFWREENKNINNSPNVASVGVTGALRSNATIKIHTTKIVMYMYREKVAVFLFVTDSVEIESRESNRTIRIRSSSHNRFKNTVPIKARTFGTPERSGGVPLDKLGLSMEDEDNFEDFKWFEIEFATLQELYSFQLEFRKALNLRRKERKYAEDLARLAMQGIKG